MRPVKPFDTYIGILIIRGSQKSGNSSKEGVQSDFHNFCPGLPVSLTLCPISQSGTLSQMVSVHLGQYAALHICTTPQKVHTFLIHMGQYGLEGSSVIVGREIIQSPPPEL
jgi:hypothetical protein